MYDVMNDVRARAQVTPSLPAVRYAGQMVTYGDLDRAIETYSDVMRRHGMSMESAFYAAILHSIPALAEITDADAQGRALDQVVEWLSRHVSAASGEGLRAVG